MTWIRDKTLATMKAECSQRVDPAKRNCEPSTEPLQARNRVDAAARTDITPCQFSVQAGDLLQSGIRPDCDVQARHTTAKLCGLCRHGRVEVAGDLHQMLVASHLGRVPMACVCQASRRVRVIQEVATQPSQKPLPPRSGHCGAILPPGSGEQALIFGG